MLARVVFGATLLAAIGRPSWPQDTALTQPSLGILARGTSIDAQQAITSCPPFIGGHRGQLESSVPEDSSTATCTVERVESLGNAVGLRSYEVKYLRRYVFPADSIKRGRWMVQGTTIVIKRAAVQGKSSKLIVATIRFGSMSSLPS